MLKDSALKEFIEEVVSHSEDLVQRDLRAAKLLQSAAESLSPGACPWADAGIAADRGTLSAKLRDHAEYLRGYSYIYRDDYMISMCEELADQIDNAVELGATP